jgi:hypothetical protein
MRGRRLGWVPGTAAVVTLMVLTMYSGFLISRLVTAVNGCVLFSDIGEAAAGSKVRAPPSRPPRSASARAARPQQGRRPPRAGALAGAGDCAQLRRDAVYHPAPRDLAEPAARGRQRGRAARGVLAGHRDSRAVLHPGAQPLRAGLAPRGRPILLAPGDEQVSWGAARPRGRGRRADGAAAGAQVKAMNKLGWFLTFGTFGQAFAALIVTVSLVARPLPGYQRQTVAFQTGAPRGFRCCCCNKRASGARG